MTDPAPGYVLAHPVYLDVAMMISFLAYLEGGVVTGAEETTKEAGTRERALKGRAGFRARLPWALDAEAGSEGSANRREETSLESKSARQHTAASLFNLLTVSSEYYSATTNEYLRAGSFRVIGKVTRIVEESDAINLTRRTFLGAADSELVPDMIGNVRSGTFRLDVADPIVGSPAVQILPMAIFI